MDGRRRLVAALVVAVLAVPAAVVTLALRSGDGEDAAANTPPRPSAGCGRTDVAAGAEVLTLTSGGKERGYVRQVPPAHDGRRPVPVVVDLHGWGEPALAHADYTGLGRYGEAHGFVTLTPQGAGGPPAWDPAPGSPDVAFVGDLLDEAEDTLCVDTDRVYVAGVSNGAMLASTLACVEADRLAAVAAVAGVSPVVPAAGVPAAAACVPRRSVPLLAFHGTDDPVVRYDGGFAPGVEALPGPDGTPIGERQRRADLSVPEIMAVWAERFGCDDEPASPEVVEGNVSLVAYPCPDGAAVDLYVVDGGGHGWPGANTESAYPPLAAVAAGIGRTSSVPANALIWTFFSSHPR